MDRTQTLLIALLLLTVGGYALVAAQPPARAITATVDLTAPAAGPTPGATVGPTSQPMDYEAYLPVVSAGREAIPQHIGRRGGSRTESGQGDATAPGLSWSRTTGGCASFEEATVVKTSAGSGNRTGCS